MDSAGRKLAVGWVPILLWLYGGIVVFSGIMRFVVTGQALTTG